MKKITSQRGLTTTLFFCCCLTLFAQLTKKVTIIHTNDVHSRIEPTPKNEADPKNGDLGGFLRRAAFVKEERAKDKEFLLLDAGDFSQGTPYYNMYKGEVEIKLMNEMGYDAGTIGNHEFDFGMENMARLFKMAKFPIVNSNYGVEGTSLEGLVKPYIVIKRNGLKIGIIGLGVQPEGLIQAAKYEGMTYKEPIPVANEMAIMLKKKLKCDVVICLSHLGWSSDVELAKQSRNIDAIIGGHSHTFKEKPEYFTDLDGKKVSISQMGKNGLYVGKMELTFQKR